MPDNLLAGFLGASSGRTPDGAGRHNTGVQMFVTPR